MVAVARAKIIQILSYAYTVPVNEFNVFYAKFLMNTIKPYPKMQHYF